jgi:hypothetical protein
MLRMIRSRVVRSPWRLYDRHLEKDERVIADAEAFAAGTGLLIATGAAAGALSGALAWTLIETAALLPLAILGAFVGIAGGALIAGRRARSPAGPGAAVVRLVLTNQRLLTLRQRTAIRIAPLRSHRLEDIAAMVSRAARLGRYQDLTATMRDRSSLHLLVAGPHDFAQLWESQRRAVTDRAASQDEPSG